MRRSWRCWWRCLSARGASESRPGIAAAAGVRSSRAAGILGAQDSVALVVTGNGLKDTASALQALEGPEDVGLSVEAVLQLLEAES